MAVNRVTVDNDLGIQAVQVALVSDDQRVDFEQCQIFLFEHLGQAKEDVDELFDLITLQAQLERQLTTLIRLSAGQGIDGCFQDLFRSLFSNFLDLDTTFGGSHEHDATAGAVNNRTQIQLVSDIGAGFNQNFGNRLTIGVCLISHQTLAQPFFGKCLGVSRRVNQLYTTCFTTATGVNLGFYNPLVSANFFSRFSSRFRSIYRDPFGDRQTIFGKQLFTLVLVKVHALIRCIFGYTGTPTRVQSVGIHLCSADRQKQDLCPTD